MADKINLVQKKRVQLQAAIGDLGALVIQALNQSVVCLKAHDLILAARIIEADAAINQQRRLLEQQCLVTLAAYQPAGEDLRALGACMELVSELERIGDYAGDVASVMLKIGEERLPPEPVAAILGVAGNAIAMLTDALDAFTSNSDESTARAAVVREAQVDRDEEAIIQQVLGRMRTDAGFALTGTYLLWIVHNYERVADRATNVAERAVYVAAGQTPDLN
ncbi:phosphate signaling complex protein PhoU [Thiocystis violascens]|uniref:Phosphate-specific transport system accessory protein PhoU n=1 Tax=Thiocystis violascens (strain ATCC 17096 / DSM 198 / 6111) TaxID=765911 RepID=I3YAQ9_THIV6|nr:phosphate signaling complex protein PhoU [Thiocystis violascens]AFL74077.1 phosphate uptake regulator, PhoU [Thiocystis violascens DSM 198]